MRLSSAKPVKSSWLKSLFEVLFNNRLGNAIDNVLMKITAGQWIKKTLSMKRNAKGNIMAMDVNKHYSKPDPRNFQSKLMLRYETKVFDILHHAPTSIAH